MVGVAQTMVENTAIGMGLIKRRMEMEMVVEGQR